MGDEKPERSDLMEARRMLAVAFDDVSPQDAKSFRKKAYPRDHLQDRALKAVAALVRRFDRTPS